MVDTTVDTVDAFDTVVDKVDAYFRDTQPIERNVPLPVGKKRKNIRQMILMINTQAQGIWRARFEQAVGW